MGKYEEDFTWDFNSSAIKVRLKIVFDKFVMWQDASGTYIQEPKNYESEPEPL
jgi:hypothetical protein